MRLCLAILYYFFTTYTSCAENMTLKTNNPLPYFRIKVEELQETPAETTENDSNMNLLSFLLKNVKEIFSETEVPRIFIDETTLILSSPITSVSVNSTIRPNELNLTLTTFTKEVIRFKNVTKPTLASAEITTQDVRNEKTSTSTLTTRFNKNVSQAARNKLEITERSEFIKLEKVKLKEKVREYKMKSDKKYAKDVSSEGHQQSIDSEPRPSRRSCIVCNNIKLQECNDPKNKLIPSIICEHDEDLCYSQQTPFGLIDRGCYNVNLNLTTYVCSCNLCNYISISEMPYIFSKKKDWVENVIDLSRNKNFRKSIFKDMSCLSCEVNSTSKSTNMLDNANCLEGNIGVLPTQECEEDEICGVRALRNDGYIWRGCLKGPLYNYWWSLCDSDLCNYDGIISIYDDI